MKKTTPQQFKEDYQIIRELGKKYNMSEDFIKRSCKGWKIAVRTIEAQKFRVFNFRNIFKKP